MRSRVVFFVARLIPSLLGVATTALMTRLLDPATYGLYALGLSIIFFLTIGVFEWLGLSLLRLAPTVEKPEQFFGTIMTCVFGMFVICVVGAALILVLGGLANYASLAAACLFAAFASAWVELKQRLQLAELREAAYFWTNVGRGVVTTVLVSAAAYLYGTAPEIVLALATSILLAGLIVREPRLNFMKLRFDATVCRTLLRFGLPLSISVGLATILASVDRWLLQGLSGAPAVGLFSAAALVTQVPVLTLANCIGPSAYSMAVQAVEFRSAEAAAAQLAENFVILLGLVLPGAAGIIALSVNLAHVVVGEAYWSAVIALAPWLAAAAVVSSVRAFYVDIAFQLAHKTSPLMGTMLLAVVVNVALDVWLIPMLGELGAAVGSFTALVVGFVVAVVLSRRVYRLPFPAADTSKIMASSAIMFLVLHQMAGFSGPLALAGQVAVGSLIYLGCLLASNVLHARERFAQQFGHLRRRLLSAR